jgi:hypothetical protein
VSKPLPGCSACGGPHSVRSCDTPRAAYYYEVRGDHRRAAAIRRRVEALDAARADDDNHEARLREAAEGQPR